jgi:hypothetical protein
MEHALCQWSIKVNWPPFIALVLCLGMIFLYDIYKKKSPTSIPQECLASLLLPSLSPAMDEKIPEEKV